MEFEPQKPITDAYREGWQRVFGYWPHQQQTESHLVTSLGRSGNQAVYPNGCPILPSEGDNG